MSYIHSTHHTLLILIGFFYFTLGNLMPRYRSSLSAIQLLGIVKRSIPFYSHLSMTARSWYVKLLCYEGSGYTFHIHDSTKIVYGTVAAVVAVAADNLGSNALGGFKESCSAMRPCRQCLATQEEARCKVS